MLVSGKIQFSKMIGHFGWRKVSLTKMIDTKMIGWKQNRGFPGQNDRSCWWLLTVVVYGKNCLGDVAARSCQFLQNDRGALGESSFAGECDRANVTRIRRIRRRITIRRRIRRIRPCYSNPEANHSIFSLWVNGRRATADGVPGAAATADGRS